MSSGLFFVSLYFGIWMEEPTTFDLNMGFHGKCTHGVNVPGLESSMQVKHEDFLNLYF